MNTIRKGVKTAAVAGVAAVTFMTLAPSVALAESPSGADLLLPKPAEFIPALIAFLIIWFVLGKFAWPSILKMMESRQEKIQKDLDAAENSHIKAEEDQKTAAASIDEARRKADEIVSAAKREGEEERARIIEQAKREASDIIAKGHSAVDSERRRCLTDLSSSVVDLSVEIAGKIIGNELDEAQQRRLAEKYLAEVGKPDERK